MNPAKGKRVKVTRLGETRGMLIKQIHMSCRRVGVTGTMLDYAAGHGGDVWFVQHDGADEIGAYCYDELEEIKEKP